MAQQHDRVDENAGGPEALGAGGGGTNDVTSGAGTVPRCAPQKPSPAAIPNATATGFS